jgi:hypothetical protein
MTSADDKLQEYLDGRLGDAQRAEIEERMKTDPELARRVAAYRDLGRSLREDDAALPPGFYTRVRARFEEGGSSRRTGWARLLSWEAAGLTAAVALAVALFLPGWLRQGRPDGLVSTDRAVTTLEQDAAPEQRPEKKMREAEPSAEAEALAEAHALEDAEALEDAADTFAPTEVVEGLGEVAGAGEPVGGKGADREADAKGARGAVDDLAGDERQRLAEEEPARPEAFGEPPPAADLERADVPGPVESYRDKDEAMALRKVAAQAPAATVPEVRSQRGAGRLEIAGGSIDRPVAFQAVELPGGAATEGEVRIYASVEEWRASPERLERSASVSSVAEKRKEAEAAPHLRVVLIGPRPRPFSCAGITVLTTERSHSVRLGLPDGSTASLSGCLIFLPDDGREIVVADDGEAP